jgi:hypothetical protein
VRGRGGGADAEGKMDLEGLVSCYAVSAKTGLNCREVTLPVSFLRSMFLSLSLSDLPLSLTSSLYLFLLIHMLCISPTHTLIRRRLSSRCSCVSHTVSSLSSAGKSLVPRQEGASPSVQVD